MIALFAVSAGLSQPSEPAAPADETPTAFSASRARKHVEVIAVEPRPTGSRASRRCVEYLVERLELFGLEVRVQRTTTKRSGHTFELVNVMARLRGEREDTDVLFVAHHDTVARSPGASDDGIAVAALLEVARALSAGPSLQRGVTLLLTDGEEQNKLGAKAFCADERALEHIEVVVNVEAVGNHGPTVLFETAGANGDLIASYAQQVPSPTASSLHAFLFGLLPNDTDFTELRRHGARGLNLAVVGGTSAYHAPFDTPDDLDDATLQRLGDTLLALARGLTSADLESEREVVYHDLAGLWLLRAPAQGAGPLAFAVALIALLASMQGQRPGSWLGALALMTGAIALAALASAALQVAMDFVSRAIVTGFTTPNPGGDYASALTSACGIALLGAVLARTVLPSDWATRLTRGGLAVWSLIVIWVACEHAEAGLVLAVPLGCATVAAKLCSSPNRTARWLSLALTALAVAWLASTWLNVLLLTSLRPWAMAAVAGSTLVLGLPLVGDVRLQGSRMSTRGSIATCGLALLLWFAGSLTRALGA